MNDFIKCFASIPQIPFRQSTYISDKCNISASRLITSQDMTKKQKMKTVLLAVLIVGTMIMVGAAYHNKYSHSNLRVNRMRTVITRVTLMPSVIPTTVMGMVMTLTVQEDIQMFSVAAIYQDIRLDGVGDKEEINSLVTQIAITITIITNKEQETPSLADMQRGTNWEKRTARTLINLVISMIIHVQSAFGTTFLIVQATR